MSNKEFSKRLNEVLDEIDVPEKLGERIEAFSKIINKPKFKAEAILSGNMPLTPDLLEVLTQELEVSSDWLTGKNNKKNAPQP